MLESLEDLKKIIDVLQDNPDHPRRWQAYQDAQDILANAIAAGKVAK